MLPNLDQSWPKFESSFGGNENLEAYGECCSIFDYGVTPPPAQPTDAKPYLGVYKYNNGATAQVYMAQNGPYSQMTITCGYFGMEALPLEMMDVNYFQYVVYMCCMLLIVL